MPSGQLDGRAHHLGEDVFHLQIQRGAVERINALLRSGVVVMRRGGAGQRGDGVFNRQCAVGTHGYGFHHRHAQQLA